jgi:hypothetical protein
MTSPTPNGPDRTTGTQLRRYGPFIAIVVVVAVVAAVLVFSGGDDDDETTTETSVASGEAGVQPEPTGEMPITYAEAEDDGTVDDYDWGDRCDTETGRLKMPTIYAYPCVPVFDGDNGGETWTGVTSDSIKVVRYSPQTGADIQSLLSGANVTIDPSASKDTAEDYVEVYTALAETYGREIELVTYEGTAASDDEVAARADAVKIAEELQPFAVINGPGLDGGAFAEELAAREIMCLDCSQAMPDQTIQDNAPYIWGGSSTSVNQMIENLNAWTEGALDTAAEADEGAPADAATKAVFAGSPEIQAQDRKVGVIHFEQDPPVFGETTAANDNENFNTIDSYVFSVSQLSTLPEQAQSLIAKMKDEGNTTIVFIGDPIMPIYLTQQATEQDYFPEWIIPGVGLTDTTQLARQYDPEQWAHAYGLSHLPARIPREEGDAWRLYEWYFGEGSAPPPQESTYAIIAADYARLVLGIQMAGPDLTPQTFEAGLFRVPPTGGSPAYPQISYGNWGFFDDPDYNGIDDAVPIWWDAELEGPDENDNNGAGMWRYVGGGERFLATEEPRAAPFIEEGTVTIFDEIPAEYAPPSYPAPPGSPAAG